MNAHFLIWEHGWHIAGWTMVYYLALGSLVALLAAVLRRLSRSADPTLRYATSLVVFATLALMPVGIAIWLSQSPANELPLTKLAPAPQVVDLAITPLETDSPLSKLQTPAAQTPSEPSEHGDVTAWTTAHAIEYLPWVWLAGTPLTFVLLATGLIGAERLRRTSRPVAEGPVHDAGERLRAALGVGRSVTLAICDRLATPMMVGIVRPLILLPPAALTGWSADELEMVLLHELAHIRRWDNLVNLLQRVVESLLFFHPAVWLASHWVRLDREDCCDATVVAHTAKPQAYAELLVSLVSTSHPLAGLAMARHPLAGRIRRILHLEDETMLVSRNTLVAISTALLAVLLAVSCYNPQETEALEATGRFATEDTESTEKYAQAASQQPEASRVVPDPGAPDAPSPFPTLEEQRAADVAYKVLGVELETLTAEELDRVKKKGYQGGLRVTVGVTKREGSSYRTLLGYGDLLVGLHVWPTTSLEQVNKILSRDDLDQLSPLKFYVIRRQQAENLRGEAYGGYGERGLRPREDGGEGEIYGAGEFGGRGRSRGMYGERGGYGVAYGHSAAIDDQLVTGRISVDLDAWRAIHEQQGSARDRAAALERLRQAQQGVVWEEPDTLQLLAEQERLQQHIAELEHEIAQREEKFAQLEHELSQLETDSEQREAQFALEEIHAQTEHLLQEREEAFMQMEQLTRNREERQPRQQGTLLYDGKTFDEWRNLWKTELKTENRTECIKALAAFGRAGRGKEAAEAILQIVKEYDWRLFGDGSLGSLQEAAIEAIGGLDYGQAVGTIPTDDWLPVLTDELRAGDKRIIAFAKFVLPIAWAEAVETADDETIQRVNQALKEMGPTAVPNLLGNLWHPETMPTGTQEADGKVRSRKNDFSRTAADSLLEITGSDETAIKHLESLLDRPTSDPHLDERQKQQGKLMLDRLKSRQAQ